MSLLFFLGLDGSHCFLSLSVYQFVSFLGNRPFSFHKYMDYWWGSGFLHRLGLHFLSKLCIFFCFSKFGVFMFCFLESFISVVIFTFVCNGEQVKEVLS
jgi:hypothetical protein